MKKRKTRSPITPSASEITYANRTGRNSVKVQERASCDPGHNPSAPACTSEEQELGHKGSSHVNQLLQDQRAHLDGSLSPPAAAPGSVCVRAEAVMSERRCNQAALSRRQVFGRCAQTDV